MNRGGINVAVAVVEDFRSTSHRTNQISLGIVQLFFFVQDVGDVVEGHGTKETVGIVRGAFNSCVAEKKEAVPVRQESNFLPIFK